MSENFDAKGYYEVLELTPNATVLQIKQQYYDRAKFWHPDHNEDPNAVEIFQKISVAYDILKDQKSRLRYDLLSLIYKEKDFPEINSLKIYKNQSGKDDPALRVLKQRRVQNGVIKETKDICNYREAKDMVLSTSVLNWLKGWWGKGGIHKNIAALKFNMAMVYADDADNLKLLIHNALAYEQENHPDMAWLYAKQAQLLAASGSRAEMLLATYIDILDYHPQKIIKLPRWSAQELRIRQMLMPGIVAALIAIYGLYLMGKIGVIKLPEHKSDSYYSEIVLASGARIADDQIETKIIRVDGGTDDTSYLYHLKEDGNIYYGPDERYDVMVQGKKGQTVRIVGYTANKKWLKIMIDNGEMGYINKRNTEKGIGNPIPPRSKIYN